MVERSYGVLVDPVEHSPSLGQDDSLEATAWRPFCSCGWTGIVIISTLDITDLQEDFQKYAEKHGIDSILPSNSIFGDSKDALVQVLNHLEYDPKDDESNSHSELDNAVSALKNYDEGTDGLNGLYDLADDFPRIVERMAEQKHRNFVWENVQQPILRKNADKIETELKQYLISAYEKRKKNSSSNDANA
jgi:hypothetical protein